MNTNQKAKFYAANRRRTYYGQTTAGAHHWMPEPKHEHEHELESLDEPRYPAWVCGLLIVAVSAISYYLIFGVE